MRQSGSNQALIQAARDMAEANNAYGSSLVANANLLLEMVGRLEDGVDVVEIVRSTPGGPGRSAARDAAKALKNARRGFRSAMVSACVERGMARKEIARSLGCSPQLVSRYWMLLKVQSSSPTEAVPQGHPAFREPSASLATRNRPHLAGASTPPTKV